MSPPPLTVALQLPTTARALVELIKSLGSVAASSATKLRISQQIHAFAIKSAFATNNEHISSSFIICYANLNCYISPRKLFDEIRQPNLVSWTALIRSHAILDQPVAALERFKSMLFDSFVVADPICLATAISASRRLGSCSAAKMIHGFMITAQVEVDAFVSTELIVLYGDHGELEFAWFMFSEMPVKNLTAWNAIIHQYVKHGKIDIAANLFDTMPRRDIVSWNTMISGLCLVGRCRGALTLFTEMMASRMRPNELTICTVLSACASIGALEIGMWIHAYLRRSCLNLDGSLDHCLIDMYAKCGSIDKAMQVFGKVPVRTDLYSWTSIICGLAMHGHASETLKYFSKMQNVGVKPDDVTLIGILNACAHGGLVDQGCEVFYKMKEVYGLSPKIEHYGCMIDLFSRVGCLKEAYNLVINMPAKPNVVIWGTLLNACKVHKNLELGEIAAKNLIELNPDDQWARVMLANIYADARNWEGVMRLRKEVGMRKAPGCSSIELNGEVHEFLAMGKVGPQYMQVYDMLELFEAHMQMI